MLPSPSLAPSPHLPRMPHLRGGPLPPTPVPRAAGFLSASCQGPTRSSSAQACVHRAAPTDARTSRAPVGAPPGQEVLGIL